MSALTTSARQPADAARRLEELEQGSQLLGAEHHALAGKLELLRAELERTRLGAERQYEKLQQECRQAGDDRNAIENRLVALDQSVSAAASAHDSARDRFAALETSLAESVDRLDTRCNQLKFLQDSERRQFGELRTALAETASRLETRDDGLGQRLDDTSERLDSLNAALLDTAGQLQSLREGLETLESGNARLARQSEAVHATVSRELEASALLVGALEQRIEQLHRAQLDQFGEMRSLWNGRYVRIRTALFAIAFVLALVTAALVL